jgi:hypothetical protein
MASLCCHRSFPESLRKALEGTYVVLLVCFMGVATKSTQQVCDKLFMEVLLLSCSKNVY